MPISIVNLERTDLHALFYNTRSFTHVGEDLDERKRFNMNLRKETNVDDTCLLSH